MTTEEKELLLKDLCARLPYGVIVSIKELDSDRKPWFGELSCKDLDYFIHDAVYESVKPYLRPISSMTAEEKEDFGVPFTSEGLVTLADTVECMDWLLSHHFDYRSLIEKGLAIEAPEGMYKTE